MTQIEAFKKFAITLEDKNNEANQFAAFKAFVKVMNLSTLRAELCEDQNISHIFELPKNLLQTLDFIRRVATVQKKRKAELN